MLGIVSVAEHPIHVSVSEVEISSEMIEWTARMFTDDLLLGLYGKKAKMEALKEEEKIRKDILRYLSSHIIVILEDHTVQWRLSDIQSDPEALWITLTADISQKNTMTLTVMNNALMEIYKDQKNIVRLTLLSKTKNLIFESGGKEKRVTF
jgi:hypothetical protein